MQLEYRTKPRIALPGMMGDSGYGDVVSATAVGNVQAGVFVARTGDYSQFLEGGKVSKISAETTAHEVAGVSVYLATKADTSVFSETQTVPVKQRGRIWVRVTTGTTRSDTAQGVWVSTTEGKEGWITKPSEPGALRIYGARVWQIQDDLALVDLNMPAEACCESSDEGSDEGEGEEPPPSGT